LTVQNKGEKVNKKEVLEKLKRGDYLNKSRAPGLTPAAKKRFLLARHGKRPKSQKFFNSCEGDEVAPRKEHEHRKPSDIESSSAPKRDKLYKLREDSYHLQPNRIKKCGRCKIETDVKVRVYQTNNHKKRATYGGVAQCGDINRCPVCSQKIRGARGQKLAKEAEAWIEHCGNGSLAMLTLTIRHNRKMNLADLKNGLFEAFKRMTSTLERKAKKRGGKSIYQLFNVIGRVRAFELTYSEKNGFHPHLHILLFFGAPVQKTESNFFERYLKKTWPHFVAAQLGEECRPTFENGADLKVVYGKSQSKNVGEYMSKIGYEMTDPVSKSSYAKGGSFSMFEVLEKAIQDLKGFYAQVWREYSETIPGTRVLEYSRKNDFKKNLQNLAGTKEKTDEEILQDADRGETAGTLSGQTWAMMGDKRRGKYIRLEFLHVVEKTSYLEAFNWLVRHRLWKNEHSDLTESVYSVLSSPMSFSGEEKQD